MTTRISHDLPGGLEAATARVLAAAAALDDAGVRAPSRLPGWTRGHVLTHLARNADGLVNLLTWARTGVETPMYAGQAERDAAIEAGARRPVAEQVADLTAASERFATAAAALPPDRGDVAVHGLAGRPMRAGDVPWGRLREVEIHHVDLGLEYTPALWDSGFVGRLLPEVAASYAERDGILGVALRTLDGAPVGAFGPEPRTEVTGDQRALLVWLLGRSAGEGLTAAGPDGARLPVLPRWA